MTFTELRSEIASAEASAERGGKCIVHFDRGRLSHGCERGAPMDGFTACPGKVVRRV